MEGFVGGDSSASQEKIGSNGWTNKLRQKMSSTHACIINNVREKIPLVNTSNYPSYR